MHEHMYQLLKRIWAQRAAYSLLLPGHFANHIMQLMLQVLLETESSDCRTREQAKDLEREKAYAQKIMPLVSRHHLLLVTLLLFNAVANECLPIFLDEVV
jgi:hypothetical protein